MIGILSKVLLFYILLSSNGAIFSNSKMASLYKPNVRQLALVENYDNSYTVETYANVLHDNDFYEEDQDDTLFEVGLKVTFLLLPIFIGVAAFKNINTKDKKGKD